MAGTAIDMDEMDDIRGTVGDRADLGDLADLLGQLLTIEHAGWRSLCDGAAADFYGELMTDDGVMVLANGQIMDRDDVVHALRDAAPWSAYDIDAPRAVRAGPEATALVYVGTGRRDEADPFVGAMSSVYRLVDGRWRLALYQQSPRA